MMTMVTMDTSIEGLQRAIDATEAQLSQYENSIATRQRQADDAVVDASNTLDVTDDTTHDIDDPLAITQRLNTLERQANDLLLAKQATAWASQCRESDRADTVHDSDGLLGFMKDLENLDRLADLLRNFDPRLSAGLYQQLYLEEYLPLHEYLQRSLILVLRSSLKSGGYPLATGCADLLQEAQDSASVFGGDDVENKNVFSSIATSCRALTRLSMIHTGVKIHVEGSAVAGAKNSYKLDDVLTELCRPLVDRVRFHFLHPSPDRPTSTNIERLPEWLCLFVKEQVFESGVWDLVSVALLPHISSQLPLDFIHEILRMMQWVLGERNFFRDTTMITGPKSQPELLSAAIDHLLQFDAFIQALEIPNIGTRRRISLMDVFVAGDDELLAWWLERERERVFSILFDTDHDDGDEDDDDRGDDACKSRTWIPPRAAISSRAELFAALIRSIQIKSQVFSFSGPYLNQVGAPLCMQFLDAVHETATDLRHLLVQRRPGGGGPTAVDLQNNMTLWIELINGTHLAARVLLDEASSILPTFNGREVRPEIDDPDSNIISTSSGRSGESDLARFGRSLERLHEVLLDDFVRAFVETVLMERARLAGYMMRCSHVLAVQTFHAMEFEMHDLSPDLEETHRLLDVFDHTCMSLLSGISTTGIDKDHGKMSLLRKTALFAPEHIRHHVLSVVAEKFVEVALDFDGMTPDLYRSGCRFFARDVYALLGSYPFAPPMVPRLLDIVTLMQLERDPLVALGNALCGLAGETAPLTESVFVGDDRLFEEAMSMIRAKGYTWIELTDILSVLNRRRDLAANIAT